MKLFDDCDGHADEDDEASLYSVLTVKQNETHSVAEDQLRLVSCAAVVLHAAVVGSFAECFECGSA